MWVKNIHVLSGKKVAPSIFELKQYNIMTLSMFLFSTYWQEIKYVGDMIIVFLKLATK